MGPVPSMCGRIRITLARLPTSAEVQRASSGDGDSAKMPPMGFERDRQVEICAQCHGGIGQGLTPAFSFKPGEALAPHISLEANPLARVDVHGNQVALLREEQVLSVVGEHDVLDVPQLA